MKRGCTLTLIAAKRRKGVNKIPTRPNKYTELAKMKNAWIGLR